MKSLSLSKPHLLIMTGIPSSGKSFFAEKFSETFNAPFVNFHHILNLTGDSAVAEQTATYMLNELMKTKQSLIVEGKSDSKKDRVEFARYARENGYEPLFIWVQTDPGTAKTRAKKVSKTKTNRVLNEDEHDRIAKRFTPLAQHEKHLVISGKHTYASQAKTILKKLSEPRAAAPVQSARQAAQPQTPPRRNINIG